MKTSAYSAIASILCNGLGEGEQNSRDATLDKMIPFVDILKAPPRLSRVSVAEAVSFAPIRRSAWTAEQRERL
jgi:hypothetical protein